MKLCFNQVTEYSSQSESEDGQQHSMRWDAKPHWERLEVFFFFFWLLITRQKTGEGTSKSKEEREREVETTVYTLALIFCLSTDVGQAVLFIAVQRASDKRTHAGMHTSSWINQCTLVSVISQGALL